MKIQFYGGTSFGIFGKTTKVAFDPLPDFKEKNLDFVMSSRGADLSEIEAKKHLSLAGEFEISGVLVRGFFNGKENTIYKVICDDLTLVHFGQLPAQPDTKFVEQLGENVDVAFINLSKEFGPKEAKTLLENLDPRMAIFGGDPIFFPKMAEISGVKTAETNPINISKSNLSDETTELLILPL